MGKFILSNMARKSDGTQVDNDLYKSWRGWLGHAVLGMPLEAHAVLDFTAQPGSTMGVMYSLLFQLRKWEYFVQKADDWIEVSPVHAQYYQLIHKQKEDIEGRIKSGLASVSQAVADLELLKHDERKYREFLHYLGYRTKKETIDNYKGSDKNELNLDENLDKLKKRVDNHSLKAVFIDQVETHTGEGISMRSIVSRWPTLITDFLRLTDDDMDVGNVKDKLNISKAEAVVLVTKNKLYAQWKLLFLGEVKSRYDRIMSLVRSREESVNSYRDWIAPFVARHKMLSEGLGLESQRKGFRTSFIQLPGQALSVSKTEIWTWKDFMPSEIFRTPGEAIGEARLSGELDPYDAWTKKTLIFDKKFGLINSHPWITDKWVKEMKDEMFNEGWLSTTKVYYTFFIISLQKFNLRTPTGQELEDGVFDVNAALMSQNVMFVKLLDLKARQEELENYVNRLLGIKGPLGASGQYSEEEKETFSDNVKQFLDYFSLTFANIKKGGPYERDFDERISKYYLASMAADRFKPIVSFIKKKCGFPG